MEMNIKIGTEDRNFDGIIEIMRDVSRKTGEIFLKVSTITPSGCGGLTKEGTEFSITWVRDRFLILKIFLEDELFIKSITKAIGYKSLYQYIDKANFLVFEWGRKNDDEEDKEMRFIELAIQENGKLIKKLWKI